MMVMQGKRFLLVLDDMWDVEADEWGQLFSLLCCGAKGSKIMITKRHNDLTKKFMKEENIVNLSALTFDESYSLFKAYAFADNEFDKREDMAKKIVKNLPAVPLVIKNIAAMCNGKDKPFWEYVRDTELLRIQNKNIIFSALRLSYQNLPPHLKRCFVYCSIFPKGKIFKKSELSELWIRQDFIPYVSGRRIEEVAHECFDVLVQRLFFEVTDYNGYYRIHDLLYDLAIEIVTNGCFGKRGCNFRIGIEFNLNFCGLLPITSRLEENDFLNLYISKKFGTLLLHHGNCLQNVIDILRNSKMTLNPLLDYLTNLRVLDLSGTCIRDIPHSIGKLRHLRHLDLSGTYISSLPNAIFDLYNLTYLNLNECYYLKEMPNRVTRLINLRQLYIARHLIASIPGIGRLMYLQNLNEFRVTHKEGHTISELGKMDELKGELCIIELENVRSTQEARDANMKNKRYLTKLSLCWNNIEEECNKNYIVRLDEDVLNGLQPPQELKTLTIRGNRGLQPPGWLGESSSLSNLSRIEIFGCRNWNHLPPLGQLVGLKELRIGSMQNVRTVGDEFYGARVGFPSLELLCFHNMRSMEKLSLCDERFQRFPCLQQLRIIDCPILQYHIVVKGAPCLEKLEIRSCYLIESVHACGLPALQILQINYCKSVTSIFIEGLPSLEHLGIEHCDNLSNLSEEFPPLSVDSLTIENCPLLFEQYKETGTLRPTIAHIENKRIWIYANGMWMY